MNPLLLAFRAIATITAAVFFVDWLFEPSALTLESARDWNVSTHGFYERSSRTTLLLSSAHGQQVKVNCAYYDELCAYVRSAGASELHVWVGELGYFKGPSLLQARAGVREIVSLSSQQNLYDKGAAERNLTKLFFLLLALLAWFGPRLNRFLHNAA